MTMITVINVCMVCIIIIISSSSSSSSSSGSIISIVCMTVICIVLYIMRSEAEKLGHGPRGSALTGPLQESWILPDWKRHALACCENTVNGSTNNAQVPLLTNIRLAVNPISADPICPFPRNVGPGAGRARILPKRVRYYHVQDLKQCMI